MKTYPKVFQSISIISNKLKIIPTFTPILSIPLELKQQFNRHQLNSNVYRLKILCVSFLSIHILDSFIKHLPIGLFLPYRLREYLDGYLHSGLVFLCLPTFLSLVYFSKKKNDRMLWIVCYLFIFFYSFMSITYIYSVCASFYLIHLAYVLSVFIITLLPEFNLQLFLSLAIAYFVTIAYIFTYRLKVGSDEYISDIFFISTISIVVVVAKIWIYNNGIRTVTQISKILELNNKLKALSTTDELTKLNNRRSFLEYIDIVWKQNLRLNLPLTVLVIDVDYFKKYNDSLGHLEGDKALIAIAQCIKNHAKRETDFVARFGGEEFVCLLPYIKKDEAFDFANTLVADVEGMKIPHPMNEHSNYLTISAGMASIVPNDNTSYTKLLDEADKALYAAKGSGRNRVVVN